MFLDIYSNHGERYIRICESYRVEKNGVKVARKRQIKSIGPVSRFLKLALYGRILDPASKIATVSQNSRYYSPFLSEDAYEYNVYDMLDFVYRHKDGLFNRIDLNMRRS